MPTVIHKPSLFQRLMPLLKGFDGPLAFGIFVLAGAGLLTMYSSGFANGARFVDHGRNMLIAGFIMFVVAQIPPQRLMAFAVPIYTVGLALLVAPLRSLDPSPSPLPGWLLRSMATLQMLRFSQSICRVRSLLRPPSPLPQDKARSQT